MEVINISDWEKDLERQASGTREKFWVYEPNDKDDKFLFKVPKNTVNENWAEVISSLLGKKLGFPMMDVCFADFRGQIGTLAKNFVEKNEELNEGGDLFFAIDQEFDRYHLNNYTISNIIKALKPYKLESEFVKIPIFDALIGNQDRHCDNWGIITKNNEYNLSPIYDNGTSLGFNTSDDYISKALNDNRTLQGFCNRGKTLIGLDDKRKPKHLEVLEVLNQQYPDEFTKAFNQILNMNEQMVKEILNEIPNDIMNDFYKDWVFKLLLFRKDWLHSWYEGGKKI
ncbi:HipA family kinase [Alkalibacillus silvisoli]|uniref:HipA-like C-terminal domain-containing protein n=1 Tax=Alkalibacillus silvisoli TaxID=392823 RepID=A0ABN0ZQB9_9BACI